MQAAKGAEQASPIKIRLNNSDDLASKLTALHLLLAVNARTCKIVDVSVCASQAAASKAQPLWQQLGYQAKIYERKKCKKMQYWHKTDLKLTQKSLDVWIFLDFHLGPPKTNFGIKKQ